MPKLCPKTLDKHYLNKPPRRKQAGYVKGIILLYSPSPPPASPCSHGGQANPLPQGEGIGGNPTASGWGIKKNSINSIPPVHEKHRDF